MLRSSPSACHPITAVATWLARLLARAVRGAAPAAAVGALAALGPLAPAGAAATLTVNTVADTLPAAAECSGLPADCSIREALDRAQSGDEVVIPASAVPYLIVHDKIGVRGGVTITGAGAEATTLSGGGADQIFNLLGGPAVTIRNLQITNGHNDSLKDEGERSTARARPAVN